MKREFNIKEQTPKFSSVIEALDYWNKTCPDENYCYLNHMNGQEEKITYKNLYDEAFLQSSKLQGLGLKRGDRVILAIPNGRSFLTSFLGTLMAGGVAVPVVTRETILQSLNKAAEVLGHIFRDAAAKYVLTTQANKALCEKTAELVENKSLVISIVDRLPKGIQLSYNPLTVFPEDVAFIQYTSGSTSLPKGVVIRHEQLVAQIQSLVHGLKSNARDCAVSWLPLFHDMGLIGAFLHTLYAGMQLVLMSPEKFLFDPKQWLMAISKYKATMSTGPNSAYSLCLSRIRPEEMKDIDLSSWRVAFSGAEPISVPTIEKFIKRFEPYGFNPKAFVSGYGMAENCLAISFVQPGEGLIYDTVQREEFERNRVAIPDVTQTVATLCFVSVGKPILDHEVTIINEEGTILPERHVGEIAVRGPSVMEGYYKRELETRLAIRNHWLYTGDLGYLADGHLYIVGRKKDMIIKGGRNFCPQDIEVVAETIEGVRRGCVVAFGVYEEKMGTEKLVVLAEVKPQFYKKREEVSSRIITEISAKIGIAPDEVVIFPRGTLTKTTSGKIQRAKYKNLYLKGKLKTSVSLKDRLQYFMFRMNLIISTFFYMISSKLKRKS